MDSTLLTTHTLRRGQPGMLCTSDIDSLLCTQGSMNIEWEQAGITFQHVLYGGGAPWQPHGVPPGTWVRLSVLGTHSAALRVEQGGATQEVQTQDARAGAALPLLPRVARWIGATLRALPLPTPFTKRNSRAG
ncbi:MAG: hypothetical protein LBE61_09175 [Burkholderiaceae bacterium]|jgi:hypothetical protein|nr:hypothetical protein [Burkholderiaceae bacterium]